MITTFLAGPYGLLLKLGAVVAVVAGIWFHGRHSGVESMRPKVEAAQSETELWRLAAENRKRLIEACNQAVEGLKASADMRVRDMQRRLEVAKTETSFWKQKAEIRVDILQNLELPENECAATFAIIDKARELEK